jgi:hypothetical protein
MQKRATDIKSTNQNRELGARSKKPIPLASKDNLRSRKKQSNMVDKSLEVIEMDYSSTKSHDSDSRDGTTSFGPGIRDGYRDSPSIDYEFDDDDSISE